MCVNVACCKPIISYLKCRIFSLASRKYEFSECFLIVINWARHVCFITYAMCIIVAYKSDTLSRGAYVLQITVFAF